MSFHLGLSLDIANGAWSLPVLGLASVGQNLHGLFGRWASCVDLGHLRADAVEHLWGGRSPHHLSTERPLTGPTLLPVSRTGRMGATGEVLHLQPLLLGPFDRRGGPRGVAQWGEPEPSGLDELIRKSEDHRGGNWVESLLKNHGTGWHYLVFRCIPKMAIPGPIGTWPIRTLSAQVPIVASHLPMVPP